jgi:hypothetical protein
MKVKVIFLTKGERSEIIKKIISLREIFEVENLDFEMIVSLNHDEENPPILQVEEFLLESDLLVYRQPKFIDSVEEHVLSSYERFSDLKNSEWVWLMDDSDEYETEYLKDFLNLLKKTDKKLIFVNSTEGTLENYGSEPKVFSTYNDKVDLSQLLLNCGITQAPSKMGSWVIQSDLLRMTDFDNWRIWLAKTTLFTHGYFYLALSLKNTGMGLFYSKPLLAAKINLTDIDRSKVWLNWYENKNTIFQYDWTIGQAHLLRYFVEKKLLSPHQVKNMIISCSQRGVLPLQNDLVFRIVVNQLLPAFKTERARICEEDAVNVFNFLSSVNPIYKPFYESAKIVLSDAPVSGIRRYTEYRKARDFYFAVIDKHPWQLLLCAQTLEYDIFSRTSGYVGIHRSLNPAQVFRDSSLFEFSNNSVIFGRSISEIQDMIYQNVSQYHSFQNSLPVTKAQELVIKKRYSFVEYLGLKFLNPDRSIDRKIAYTVRRLFGRFL